MLISRPESTKPSVQRSRNSSASAEIGGLNKFVRLSSDPQSLRAFTPHPFFDLSQTQGVKISK